MLLNNFILFLILFLKAILNFFIALFFYFIVCGLELFLLRIFVDIMIFAIIMAGGKGERLKSDLEKPLFPLNNKPLIDYVIENIKTSNLIEEIIIAVSPNAPNTKKYLIDTYALLNYEHFIKKSPADNQNFKDKSDFVSSQGCCQNDSIEDKSEIQNKFSYLDTLGNGYVEDLSDILSFFEKKSKEDILIFINADLPLISSEMVDDVIRFYLKQDKPALSTVVPVEIFEDYNIDYEYEFEGNVPSGLNILRSENVIQDEVILKVPKVEFAFNINTVEAALEFNRFLKKE